MKDKKKRGQSNKPLHSEVSYRTYSPLHPRRNRIRQEIENTRKETARETRQSTIKEVIEITEGMILDLDEYEDSKDRAGGYNEGLSDLQDILREEKK